MNNGSGRQGYPFTAVSNSTTSQPGTSRRNLSLESNGTARSLDGNANFDGSQSQTDDKLATLSSSSPHTENLCSSKNQTSDDECNPISQQYPQGGGRNSFYIQHNIVQPNTEVTRVGSSDGLDKISISRVDRFETARRIEDINPEDGEVELSDVEDESKASKGFFQWVSIKNLTILSNLTE
jgi:hypothetical protein